MQRRRLLLIVATAVYGLAWLLPSVVHAEFPFFVARGWGATLAALQPTGLSWPVQVLSIASALSNLIFAGAAALAWARPARVSRSLEWAVWVAALIDTQWFVLGTVGRDVLRSGYYLWVLSFVLLGIALHRARMSAAGSPSGQPAA